MMGGLKIEGGGGVLNCRNHVAIFPLFYNLYLNHFDYMPT